MSVFVYIYQNCRHEGSWSQRTPVSGVPVFDVGIKSSGVLKTGGVLLMKKLSACPEKAACLKLS